MKRIVLLLLFALGCASARAPDVREAMSDWMTALNALDEAGIIGAFAEDATAFFPVVKAERLDGKAAIAAVFHDYVAVSKKTNIVPEELRVQQRGDVAIVTFNVHNPSAVSRRTFVWRYDGGAWKIVHLHASNVATFKRE
jgi:ketosteroid isomerase-like protein